MKPVSASRRAALVVLAAGAGAACTPDGSSSPGSSPSTLSSPSAPAMTQTPTPERTRRISASDVRVATAMGAVAYLAGTIGPRHGTSVAYDRAARWVGSEFARYGWEVRRQRVPTPGGLSWGVPVEAGDSTNLIATHGRLRQGKPWLAVGAHLDTVPQSPGGEDNGSGIGVLLALAEAIGGTAERSTRLPVVLIAFGSEEPRGPSDDDHHYGSRAYVASLSKTERRGMRGMVSLDRVGVGAALPVGSPGEPDNLSRSLRRAADAVGVPTIADSFQRSSDHWSFVREGLPGVRLGSTPYAAYHSAADTADVVERAQLRRAMRTVASWLA